MHFQLYRYRCSSVYYEQRGSSSFQIYRLGRFPRTRGVVPVSRNRDQLRFLGIEGLLQFLETEIRSVSQQQGGSYILQKQRSPRFPRNRGVVTVSRNADQVGFQGIVGWLQFLEIEISSVSEEQRVVPVSRNRYAALVPRKVDAAPSLQIQVHVQLMTQRYLLN